MKWSTAGLSLVVGEPFCIVNLTFCKSDITFLTLSPSSLNEGGPST